MKDTFNQEVLLAVVHFWETATGGQPAPAHAGGGLSRF